ncbi:MAG: dockerin type I repeat-containing protein, partial [Ruminococcus sp.]|nr:dockerin type I repeat-containing protein [Ruminococcus sp.]
YWVVSDGYENPIEEDLTDEELNAGYKVITDPKPAIFYTDGSVNCGESRLYLDDSSNQYVTDAEKVYKVEEKTVRNGDTDYHILTEAPDVSKDSLKSDEREEYLDLWNYTLEGEEYHYTGSGVPAAGAAVKGTITSFLDEEGEISAVLYKGDEVVKTAKVKGNTAAYALEDVPAGEYVLSVSKDNHITREYSVTVADADVTQDVKINPKGDVNGDGETDIMDCSLAQRYIRELTDLDPYQIACGDVSGTGDGELDIQDVSRILRHIRELAMLY